MRATGAAIVVLVTGCFVSPVMTFGSGKTAKEAQHDSLNRLTPPGLVVDGEWTGTVSVAKIRVWADDDYRAQNTHWQQAFREQLDYANEVLASQFGVRLEPEFRSWSRHAPGTTLDETLTALALVDPGEGVLTVMGITSSLNLSATFDQLGVGLTPGRYLVVRGYADIDERVAFDRAFRDLSADERAALYQARRRHKTTALLLHELGHNLGAQHQPDTDTLMNAMYSDHSSSFDATSRDVILAALDERLHRARRSVPKPTSDASAAGPHDSHPSLVIIVDASGRSIIGGNAVDGPTLDGLLRLSVDDDRDTAIIIQPTRDAPHSAVAKVLELAKAAGLQRVSVSLGKVQ